MFNAAVDLKVSQIREELQDEFIKKLDKAIVKRSEIFDEFNSRIINDYWKCKI